VLGFVNILNARPLVNVITAFVIALLCFVSYILVEKFEKYNILRITWLVFITFFYLPFGYWTSPGTTSAMLYISLFAIFMSTLIAYKKWEYFFPFSGLIITLIMIRTELLYPDHYIAHQSESMRLFDISINYTIVTLAIILTVLFIVRSYKKHNELLYVVSITDSLTGLYNRRYYSDYLDKIKEFNTGDSKIELTLIYMDINNFKKVNDKYGHKVGDEVLEKIAMIIKQNIRKEDIAARYGGDEFAILLFDTDPTEAKSYVKRLRFHLDQYTDQYKDVELSVGLGYEDNKKYSVDELVIVTDQKLYIDKKERVIKKDN
jgi:diguanylate cyclase (GGDEF)-like protein